MTNTLNTKKRFNKVYLEITNICDLACPFCAKSGRQKRFMTEDEFARAAGEIKTVSDHVYFHLLGEPTLHPLLQRFTQICENVGLAVNLTTNGTNPQSIPYGAGALRKVTFSLHAAEANGLDLREYAAGVRQAMLALSDAGKITELRLWNGGSANNGYLLSLIGKLPPRTFIEYGEKFVWPHGSDSREGAVFCKGLRDQCGILCDGTVVPCCLDSEGEISLGNVFESPLTDILESDRAKALVRGFSDGKPPEKLCRKCTFYSVRSKHK